MAQTVRVWDLHDTTSDTPSFVGVTPKELADDKQTCVKFNPAAPRELVTNGKRGVAFFCSDKDEEKEQCACREVLEETRRKNELEIVKLTATMEQLRRVVRALDADVPAHMRMVIISRVQRLLQGISDTVPRLSASERAPLLAAVAEVWAWVKAQLSERLDEALALVQESESDRGGDAIKEEKAASRARRQDGGDDDDDGGDGDGGDGDGVGGETTIGAGETDPAEP